MSQEQMSDFSDKEIVMDEKLKKEIETICDGFLSRFAAEHDGELADGGGFADEENFYDWIHDTDEVFVINFFSISQDDFFDQFDLFEKMDAELREVLEEKVKIKDLVFEGDCPIAYVLID